MHDRLQPCPRPGVVEHDPPQPRPVQPPPRVQNVFTESVYHLRKAGRPGLDRTAGQHIGVHHRGAQPLPEPRDRRLAASDIARQANTKQGRASARQRLDNSQAEYDGHRVEDDVAGEGDQRRAQDAVAKHTRGHHENFVG